MELDKTIAATAAKAAAMESAMRQKASTIGNIVHESVPVSNTEVSPVFFRFFSCFYSYLFSNAGRQRRHPDILP